MRIFIGLLILACSISMQSTAQTVNITGKVLNQKGTPITQATISVKGTTTLTITDAAGAFTLRNLTASAVLIVTHTGYLTKEVPVSGRTRMEIELSYSTTDLDEVVVQAYGTTTRRLNTGSIGRVSAAEIEKQPVSNPLAALQGRVPGVVITQTSGVPGSEFKVEIRGRSSLDLSLSRNDPLYVIDNVPFEPGNVNANQLTSAASNPTSITQGGLSPLNSINPADIESIEVLKDADATAIYGSRGANGVILITTKKGKPGKTRFNLNASAGASRISRSMNMLNTEQYIQMRREAFANDGTALTTTNAPDILLWDTTRYTDLTKLLIGRAAFTSSIQASVSGGTATTQFSVGGGYYRQTNVFSNTLADNVRSARFTLNHTTPDKKFTLAFSGIYSSDQNNLISTDLTRYISLAPNLKLYDSLGNLAWRDNGINYSSLNIINPLSVLERKYTSVNENLSGNLLVSYQVLPGLVVRSSLGYNTFTTNETSIRPRSSIAPTSLTLASSEFAGSKSSSYIIEPQAEYRKAVGNGQFTVLAGATFQDRSSSSYTISASNYTNDLLLGAIGAADQVFAGNTSFQYRYSALFGRVNYAWQKSTYIINLTGRRDASSRFGSEKRSANFGAVGASWIFSNYTFIKNNFPFLSFGKLRGSYGITGNDQIGNYRYLNLWNPASVTYQGVPGFTPNSLFNADYSWEINKKLEGAIELGFLDERILFSAVLYRNRSSNQITNYILPSQTGFETTIRNLPALVQNTGVELLLSGKIVRRKNLEWSASLNMTIPKNKLVSFPGLATSSYSNLYIVGEPMSVIRGYDYLGVDPKTGIYAFRDVDGDGLINGRDRLTIGNLNPTFYGGLQNTLEYKGIQLSIFFEFKKQTGRNYLGQLTSAPPGTVLNNQPDIVLNRWRQDGNNSPVQRFSTSVSGPAGVAINNNLSMSSGIYGDASFVRCKNISLSYTLPAGLMKRLHVESSRLFLHAQNLFVITGYEGSDPETQNFYILPPLRSVVAGIQVTL